MDCREICALRKSGVMFRTDAMSIGSDDGNNHRRWELGEADWVSFNCESSLNVGFYHEKIRSM